MKARLTPSRASDMSRRELFRVLGIAAAGMASASIALDPALGHGVQSYVLPPLPYDTNALQGFLSAEILEIHHDKHHAGYVQGLMNTLEAMEGARLRGDFSAIQSLSRDLAFHGSGHVLHSIYWSSMSPHGGGEPTGSVKEHLEGSFGSIDAFRGHFAAATKGVEGNGWGILAWEPLGSRLLVTAAESHHQIVFQGAVPLLVCDVWEHAYYLQYQNRRADYVDKFFEVLNCDFLALQIKRVHG